MSVLKGTTRVRIPDWQCGYSQTSGELRDWSQLVSSKDLNGSWHLLWYMQLVCHWLVFPPNSLKYKISASGWFGLVETWGRIDISPMLFGKMLLFFASCVCITFCWLRQKHQGLFSMCWVTYQQRGTHQLSEGLKWLFLVGSSAFSSTSNNNF